MATTSAAPTSPGDASALSRGVALMWGLEPAGRRGPKPALTIGEIGAAAVALADSDGLAAVSMSKVARALGFTTMSLYRYVDSKDDLLLVMLNEAYGPPPRGRARSTWRAQLLAWCRANRAVLQAHPWILQVPLGGPPVAPNLAGWMDRGLAALAGTDLPHQQRLSALLLAEVYVRGQAQLWDGLPAEDPHAADGYAARLRQVIDPDRFPQLATALASGALEDEDEGQDSEFLFGLETILTGVERLIETNVTR